MSLSIKFLIICNLFVLSVLADTSCVPTHPSQKKLQGWIDFCNGSTGHPLSVRKTRCTCGDGPAPITKKPTVSTTPSPPTATGPNPHPCPADETTKKPNPDTTTDKPNPVPDTTTTTQKSVSAEIIGYYSWAWGTPAGSVGPNGATDGVEFSGWPNLQQALDTYTQSGAPAIPSAQKKWISIGGGNDNGILKTEGLKTLATDIGSFGANKFAAAGIHGICYDIEKTVGNLDELKEVFKNAFQATVDAGLKVMITVSHSAPYDTKDKNGTKDPSISVELMKVFLADTNVSIISPQLYSTGNESAVDWAETNFCQAAGCTWDLYKAAHSNMVIAPSIVVDNQYSSVQAQCNAKFGKKCGGFFQWKQVTQRRLSSTIKGYYSPTWTTPAGSVGPDGATDGVEFSGWPTLKKALDTYANSGAPAIPSTQNRWISIGGGEDTGILKTDGLKTLKTDIETKGSAGFTGIHGICYDIEKTEGDLADLKDAFKNVFQATVDAGLKVMITVSHSAPYQTKDKDGKKDASISVGLMKAFLADTNVSIISPQLYSSGKETEPEWAETDSCKAKGCTWKLYKDKAHSNLVIAPSIVEHSQYSSVSDQCSTKFGKACGGFFQWKKVDARRLEESTIMI